MDPTLILRCRATGLLLAQSIFREMFPALRKMRLLRHVTLRFVTVNLFSNSHSGPILKRWIDLVFLV